MAPRDAEEGMVRGRGRCAVSCAACHVAMGGGGRWAVGVRKGHRYLFHLGRVVIREQTVGNLLEDTRHNRRGGAAPTRMQPEQRHARCREIM